MIDLGKLIELQKRLPPECPVRITPFLNDPLAFIGEEKLDEKAAKLRECLTQVGAPEEILAAVSASLSLIHQAEKQLASAISMLEIFFPGYECDGRGSLLQVSSTEMRNTLWLEAFRQLGEYEFTVQMHVSLALAPEWAQILVLSKERKPEMAEALQFFDGKGWSFKEVEGPGNHVYLLEKVLADSTDLEQLLKSGREVADALEKKFSAAS